MSNLVRLALITGFALSSAPEALAQTSAASMFDRDRNVSVMQRPRAEYESEGLRMGAFFVQPELVLGIESTNNVFATATQTQSDYIFSVVPSVSATSTWSVHELAMFANIERLNYLDFSDESVTHSTFAVDGRLDVVRGTSLLVGGAVNSLSEPRSSAASAVSSAAPIEYGSNDLYVQVERQSGRIKLQGGVSLNTLDYDDGVTIGGAAFDQDFRDKDETEFNVRADYAVSPDTAFFVRYAANERKYDVSPVDPTLIRDSQGSRFEAGVDLDLGGVARGSIGVGYMEQNYDGAAFGDVDGLSIDGALEWFPSQLTTVTMFANRAINDAGIAGVSSLVNTEISITIDHEIRRNVIVSGSFGSGTDEYDGIDREDERSNWGAGATYFVNRNVGVSANVSWSEQTSSGLAASNDFEDTRFGIRLVLRR